MTLEEIPAHKDRVGRQQQSQPSVREAGNSQSQEWINIILDPQVSLAAMEDRILAMLFRGSPILQARNRNACNYLTIWYF